MLFVSLSLYEVTAARLTPLQLIGRANAQSLKQVEAESEAADYSVLR